MFESLKLEIQIEIRSKETPPPRQKRANSISILEMRTALPSVVRGLQNSLECKQSVYPSNIVAMR